MEPHGEGGKHGDEESRRRIAHHKQIRLHQLRDLVEDHASSSKTEIPVRSNVIGQLDPSHPVKFSREHERHLRERTFEKPESHHPREASERSRQLGNVAEQLGKMNGQERKAHWQIEDPEGYSRSREIREEEERLREQRLNDRNNEFYRVYNQLNEVEDEAQAREYAMRQARWEMNRLEDGKRRQERETLGKSEQGRRARDGSYEYRTRQDRWEAERREDGRRRRERERLRGENERRAKSTGGEQDRRRPPPPPLPSRSARFYEQEASHRPEDIRTQSDHQRDRRDRREGVRSGGRKDITADANREDRQPERRKWRGFC